MAEKRIYKKDLLVECTVGELREKLKDVPPSAELYVIALNTGGVEFGYDHDNVEVQLM